MPGLKQAAILVYKYLKNCLELFGYEPILETIGLWQYKTRLTKFYLHVDDFCTKYWSKDNANHLCSSISENFQYTIDKEGKK